MKYILLLILMLPSLLVGAEFRGAGFGKTVKEAKYAALSDLSQSIKSEVNSNFIHYKSATGDKLSSKFEGDVQVSSNLPIIGAEFELYDHQDLIEALVKLSPLKAKALYSQKLSTLYDEIESLEKRVRKAKNSIEKEQLLGLLLERLNEYERYRSVAIIVGVEGSRNPGVSRAEVQGDLLGLQSSIDSIKKAASVLSKPFRQFKNIYLYPPKSAKSHEITPFAKALSMYMAAELSTVTAPSRAAYLMTGEYTLGDRGMVISYTIVDNTKREKMAAKTITLPAEAYKSYRAAPENIHFDTLLHEGVVLSDSLRVSVSTGIGSDSLLFKKGEEVQLLVKLNKMGYYYIVGYTQIDRKRLTYLLELNEADGDNFVGFVNADDANRWISLGTFTVEPPFGIESIQVIASNKKISTLPPHRYDKASGYYMISKSLKKGLVKVRGLMKKKSQAKEMAEAVLLFTTSADLPLKDK
jgi:hypothetical protein